MTQPLASPADAPTADPSIAATVHPTTASVTVALDENVTTIHGKTLEASTVTPPTAPVVPKTDEVRPLKSLSSPRCQLEDFTSFSKCHLWKLMMSFYDRQGVESWAQGIVPHFITCNTFIAKKYTLLFRAFLRDAMRPDSACPLDPQEPLYIVELGTGSGKFSFFFLKALAEAESVLDFPVRQIKYVMTDFTEQNFNFWKTHPALKPFVERGMVDFAIFDATKDAELRLACSQVVLRPQELKNPLCVIANYLFDTLYHDLFQVESGILKEGLVSVGSKQAEEPDPLDPAIITRLSNLFKYEPITEDYYDDGHLNNILKWYHEYYDPSSSGATVLVPIGALSALDRLSQLSSNRLVVLSGDKGNSHPDHFRGVSDPHIAVHGSFSVMVNYHAIGVYMASRGGFALHSPQEEASLKVSLFVLPTEKSTEMTELYGTGLDHVCEARSRAFPHLSMVFHEEIVAFGPNEFFVMQKSLKEETKTPSLKAVLALLKLSQWDPDTFYKFRDVLLDHSPSSPAKLRKDVYQCLPLVWKNYYALDKEKDIAFEIGRMYYGMNDYDRALAFYTLSAHEMGKHHVTSHNMGLCHYSKRQLALAASCFEEAYALNPSYQKAATWLQRVQREMAPPTQVPEAPTVKEPKDELIVQQIELVMSDHEEETATPRNN